MSCLFCMIVEGQIPSKAVYEDEICYAFADIQPQAPIHVLVVPREHFASLSEVPAERKELPGHLLWAAARIANDQKLDQGYRVVINTGTQGGQTVGHLHVHLLGRRQMAWPPG